MTARRLARNNPSGWSGQSPQTAKMPSKRSLPKPRRAALAAGSVTKTMKVSLKAGKSSYSFGSMIGGTAAGGGASGGGIGGRRPGG